MISTRRAMSIRLGIMDDFYGSRTFKPTYFRLGYPGFGYFEAYLRGRGVWNSFWNFSRCPKWYIPIAFLWRVFFYVKCGITTRHKPIRGASSNKVSWFHHCECHYTGHFDGEYEPKCTYRYQGEMMTELFKEDDVVPVNISFTDDNGIFHHDIVLIPGGVFQKRELPLHVRVQPKRLSRKQRKNNGH